MAEENPTLTEKKFQAEEVIPQPEKKSTQVQTKTVVELIKAKEALIREELHRQYELRVQKEQQERSKQVIEGTTLGAGTSNSHRKEDKKEKKNISSSSKDSAKKLNVAEKVENGIKAIKINGPIKYRKLIQITRQMMKENRLRFSHNAVLPEMNIRINQKGSHHNIHSQHSGSTLPQPHGSKDSSVSARSANRFCQALVAQIKQDILAIVSLDVK